MATPRGHREAADVEFTPVGRQEEPGRSRLSDSPRPKLLPRPPRRQPVGRFRPGRAVRKPDARRPGRRASPSEAKPLGI